MSQSIVRIKHLLEEKPINIEKHLQCLRHFLAASVKRRECFSDCFDFIFVFSVIVSMHSKFLTAGEFLI